MKSIGKTILRLVATLLFTGALSHALAQSHEIKAPIVSQELPTLLDAEVTDWLKRGDFTTAMNKCALEVKSAPLVTEPGALASSYMCLGEAFYGLKKYSASAESFQKSIEQLEASVGVFDPILALPFEGLGKALMGMGKNGAAESALTQAKDLTHRNFGIYNLVQSRVVNRLTKIYLDRNEWPNARREQNFLMRANEKKYGETPQLLPALRRLSKFQERIGRPDLARINYRRAVNIMIRAYGENDLRLVGPLRDFASSYTNTPRGVDRVMSGAGANALRGVIDLYLQQEFSDAADVAQAWSDLGDWYVIGGRRRLARKAYIEAANVLEEAGADSDVFSKPVEIEFEEVPIFLRRSLLRGLPNDTAVIEYEFTVTASGRVGRLTVIRDDLKNSKFAIEVGQKIKQSRYRPRLVDGIPVDTPGVRKVLRYDFSESDEESEPDIEQEQDLEEEEIEEQSAPEPESLEEAVPEPSKETAQQ